MTDVIEELLGCERVTVWGNNDTLKNTVRLATFCLLEDALDYAGELASRFPRTDFTVVSDKESL